MKNKNDFLKNQSSRKSPKVKADGTWKNPSIPLFWNNLITFETTLKQLTSAKSGHFN